MKTYDAIIVGASFAGLAVANQLRGHRVLLLDRKPVGARQTSACGTILSVLQHWDLSHALLQVHNRLVLHTKWNEIEFRSPYPWCTFDYRRLCETLFERSGAEFLKVSVEGFEDGQVCTDRGNFQPAALWMPPVGIQYWPPHSPQRMDTGHPWISASRRSAHQMER